MSLTRLDLVERLKKAVGLKRNERTRVIESLLEVIKSTLEQGENLLISGFGRFEVQDKAPRKGRNPDTGETMTISARRIVVFKTSKVFRKQLNGRA